MYWHYHGTKEGFHIYSTAFILYHYFRLGLATYHAELNELGHTEINEEEDFLFLQMFIEEFHPSTVLISSNATDPLKLMLKQDCLLHFPWITFSFSFQLDQLGTEWYQCHTGCFLKIEQDGTFL